MNNSNTSSSHSKPFRDLFLRALNGTNTQERPPVWLMRQAGRYLPEYRALRCQFKHFMDLCQSKEATTELAMQPLRRFDLDAAIVFSDILTIPFALEMGLSFHSGSGPHLARPITKPSDVYALPFDEVLEKSEYVFKAVSHLKHTLTMQHNVPLIGFAGSPWTVSCYCLEGQSSAQFHKAKQFAYSHPIAMQELINQMTTITGDYLAKQAQAGADVLFLIDTWGALLPPTLYQDYVLTPLLRLHKTLATYHKINTPLMFYSKGLVSQHADFLRSHSFTGGLAFDWTCDLASAYQHFTPFAVQGNLDPCMLAADAHTIQAQTQALLHSLPATPSRFIASLGHGVLPNTPVESVHAFVDCIKSFSKTKHTTNLH